MTPHLYLAIGAGVLGIVVSTGIYIQDLKGNILESENSLLKVKKSLIISESNSEACERSVKLQNDIIRRNLLDIESSKKELEDYKNLPKEVKYKVIYKTIYGEPNATCEDLIDSVSNIDLNSMHL